MGRIKTTPIKRATNLLIKEKPGEFKKDFNENKLLVSKYITTKSKKIRNTIAGYVTRIMKKSVD